MRRQLQDCRALERLAHAGPAGAALAAIVGTIPEQEAGPELIGLGAEREVQGILAKGRQAVGQAPADGVAVKGGIERLRVALAGLGGERPGRHTAHDAIKLAKVLGLAEADLAVEAQEIRPFLRVVEQRLKFALLRPKVVFLLNQMPKPLWPERVRLSPRAF